METMQTLLERKTKENKAELERLAVAEMEKISSDLNSNLLNLLTKSLNSIEKDIKNAVLIPFWQLILIILVPLIIINAIAYFWLVKPMQIPSDWIKDGDTIVIPRNKTAVRATDQQISVTIIRD